MLMNILMLVVSAAAAVGGVRQSRISKGIGNTRMANLWLIIAGFCGLIAILQFIGLFTN
jgi:hypothetical protein